MTTFAFNDWVSVDDWLPPPNQTVQIQYSFMGGVFQNCAHWWTVDYDMSSGSSKTVLD